MSGAMIGIQHRLQLTLQFSYIHLSGNQQGKRLPQTRIGNRSNYKRYRDKRP